MPDSRSITHTGKHGFFKIYRSQLGLILIIFFALLGDIVPVLISLKHSSPSTLSDVLQGVIKWFHEIAKHIGTINFLPIISKSILGFLVGGQGDNTNDDKCLCRTIYRWALEVIRGLMNILVELVVVIVFIKISLETLMKKEEYEEIYFFFLKAVKFFIDKLYTL